MLASKLSYYTLTACRCALLSVDTAAAAGAKSNLRNRLATRRFRGAPLGPCRSLPGEGRGGEGLGKLLIHASTRARIACTSFVSRAGTHPCASMRSCVFSGPCRRCRSTAHPSNRAASEASTAAQDGEAARVVCVGGGGSQFQRTSCPGGRCR